MANGPDHIPGGICLCIHTHTHTRELQCATLFWGCEAAHAPANTECIMWYKLLLPYAPCYLKCSLYRFKPPSTLLYCCLITFSFNIIGNGHFSLTMCKYSPTCNSYSLENRGEEEEEEIIYENSYNQLQLLL